MNEAERRLAALDALIGLCDAAVLEADFYYRSDADEAEAKAWERALRERVLPSRPNRMLPDVDQLLASLDEEVQSAVPRPPREGLKGSRGSSNASSRSGRDAGGPVAIDQELRRRRSSREARVLVRLASLVTRALVWLGGGRSEVVRDVPGDRQSYALTGCLVTMSGIVSFISINFTLRIAFGMSFGILSVTLATLFSGIIVGFDRTLVTSSLPSHGSRLGTLMGFVPRLILAGALGVAVAVPLVQTVFEREIIGAFTAAQSQALNVQRAETEARIQVQDRIMSAPDSADMGVVAAQARVDQLSEQMASIDRKIACESAGTCGSGKPGAGPIVAKYIAERAVLLRQSMDAEERLARAMDEARAKTPVAAAERQRLVDQLQSLPNEITPSPENLGLLQRQAILESNLSSSGSAWFLTALLTLVVALPAAYRFAVISRGGTVQDRLCLLYTSPSPRDRTRSRMPSSA